MAISPYSDYSALSMFLAMFTSVVLSSSNVEFDDDCILFKYL